MNIVLFFILILGIDWNYNNKKTNDKTASSSPKSIPKNYKKYCKAEYKFFGKIPNYHLNKLIVIFRHGDRAPLRNINKEWENKKCVTCNFYNKNISSCKKVSCKAGNLTDTGYKQSQDLGAFIKKNYIKLLFPETIDKNQISYRVTKVGRTHSTLMGVIKGIYKTETLENVKCVINNDSLLKIKNCKYLDKLNSSNYKIDDDIISLLEENDISDGRDLSFTADEIRCAMCHNMNIELKNTDDLINKILKLSYTNWTKQMNNVRRDEDAKSIIFSGFARELLKMINSKSILNLISAHDGSLGMILSVLTSKIQEWPAYSSAIFIEIWCKGGEEFVRLIYNNEKVPFEGFDQELIPIDVFIDFILKFSQQSEKIDELCSFSPNENKNFYLVAKSDGTISKYYFPSF